MGQNGVGLSYGAGWIAALWGRMDGCAMGQDGWSCATGQDGVGLSYGAG